MKKSFVIRTLIFASFALNSILIIASSLFPNVISLSTLPYITIIVGGAIVLIDGILKRDMTVPNDLSSASVVMAVAIGFPALLFGFAGLFGYTEVATVAPRLFSFVVFITLVVAVIEYATMLADVGGEGML